jgi:succinate dehydrogenase / fumarate reductase cytochrome b subunit
MRHGFAAMFQTLGLYNYKFGRAIEIIGIIYATVVCLMFTAVVVGVYFGL